MADYSGSYSGPRGTYFELNIEVNSGFYSGNLNGRNISSWLSWKKWASGSGPYDPNRKYYIQFYGTPTESGGFSPQVVSTSGTSGGVCTGYLTITLPSYTVTLSSGGNGTVSGGGTYTEGTTITISATPSANYHFTQWSDGNTSASRQITVYSNISLTAYFDINTFSITATSAGNGSVSGGGTYSYGSTATLTASPNAHYKFLQWQDGDTSNPRSVTVTGNATYTATFVWMTPVVSTKVNGTIVNGDVKVKVSGEWLDAKKVFVKVNGTWTESRIR